MDHVKLQSGCLWCAKAKAKGRKRLPVLTRNARAMQLWDRLRILCRQLIVLTQSGCSAACSSGSLDTTASVMQSAVGGMLSLSVSCCAATTTASAMMATSSSWANTQPQLERICQRCQQQQLHHERTCSWLCLWHCLC